MSWAAVDGADKYQARVGVDGTWEETTVATVEFSDLDAGGSYSVEVQAGNGGGWSAGGSASCQALPVAPAVVCDAGSASVSGFSVSWDAVTGASRYQVRLDAGGSWLTPGSSTGHAFSDLNAGGSFLVEVQAGNGAGWSAGGSASCQTVPDAPAEPVNGSNGDGVGVQRVVGRRWTALTSTRPESPTGAWEETHGLVDRRCVLRSRTLAPAYSVEVRAGNGAGWSAGGAATCQTVPVAPAKLRCLAGTSFSVTAGWAAVDGASRYRVRIWGAGTWSEVSGTSAVLSDLAAFAEHLVQVQAGNEAGWGAAGNVWCGTKVAPPENVGCIALSSSMSVVWDAVDDATKYRVRFGDGQWAETSDTEVWEYGLAVNTEYSVQVQAGNWWGWGDIVSKTCWTTIGLPQNVACSNESSSGFTVSWDEVDGATGYQVRLGGGKPADTEETSIELTGLAADTNHVVALRSIGERGRTGSLVKLCRTRVAAPQNAACAAASNTTTEVSWDLVAGADKYRVAQQPDDAENAENPENPENAGDADSEPDWAETAKTSRTLDGLAEGNVYLIQAGNQHAWSDTATCTFTVTPPYCGVSYVKGVNIVWPKQSRIYHWTVTSPHLGIDEDLGLGTSGFGFSSNTMKPDTAYTFSLHWWHTRTGDPVGTHTLTCTTRPAP